MTAAKKTCKDLEQITGLKPQHAQECFDAFGGYAPGLASFAQSFKTLPSSYFADPALATTNAATINAELTAIYKAAMASKKTSGEADADVWKHLYGSPTAASSPFGSTNTKTAQPVFGSGSDAAKPVFGSSIPKTTPSVFGSSNEGAKLPFQPSKDAIKSAFGTSNTNAAQSAFGSSKDAIKPAFGASNTSTAATGPANPFSVQLASSTTTTAAPAGGAFSAAALGFGLSAPATTTAAPAAAPAATSAAAFGFGTKAPTSTGAAATTTADLGASGFGKAAPAAPKKEETKKTPKYCEPSHFTGPLLEMPTFWEHEVEGRAPLLNLNNGFIEANKDELRGRLEKWLAKASFYRQPVKYVEIEDEDEEIVRVIIKDADRTFFHPDHRTKLVAFLNAMYYEFNTYGQAMSYLAGLCLLALNEEETAAVIRFVATEYIKGHWAAEAVGFATSAWVVEYFMQKSDPEVAQHLQDLKFWPDTYLQKILTGLCIHVLQFNELFQFLDAFMENGQKYLIRFCLAIVEHFRHDLLAIKSSVEANALYEIMRLDSRTADKSDIRAILARAPQIELGEDGDSLPQIRYQVFEKHLAKRLQLAPKTETFEPCEVCQERRPKYWHDDIGAVCQECKDARPELEFDKY